MLTVGFSRLKARRRCHRLYHYRYRQFLERRRPRVQLVRGKLLHEMLDAHAKKLKVETVLEKYQSEYGRLFAEEREEYGDLIGDCRQIFANYLETYKNDGMTVVASEQEFRVPLIEGVEFKCTIDRVLLEKGEKRRWILDSKSHKNIPGEEARFHDLQLVLYPWAWNLKNPKRPADGIIWDYLRTKLPVEPEILQSGKLSQRANIDTTYATALRVVTQYCKERKYPISAYTEWLEGLRGREEKFLKRVFLPSPSKAMTDQLVEEMKETATEILEKPDSCVRTMTPDCSWCSFQTLCQAELRDQDADFIRKTEFQIDEEKADEEHAEES